MPIMASVSAGSRNEKGPFRGLFYSYRHIACGHHLVVYVHSFPWGFIGSSFLYAIITISFSSLSKTPICISHPVNGQFSRAARCAPSIDCAFVSIHFVCS